ncbi:hypothetical protein TRFO_30712 [Tritrichomonas foetus]|uniref:Uncharacterized protein n=1 Tax=Tritrichomonas foetus TaxID=1144522 RepID=A0A1J4JT49_9EUKA|nr:hypothetical protein TRFO_30712 [Tritrichomonas foetus]|eukprot:OHT02243.1 hypothetical protein TRFO_30712 [Tritrichomonas foetus]
MIPKFSYFEMHQKTYVIRKKIVKIKPTPIPETNYTPEIFELPPQQPPIAAESPFFENLAKPKEKVTVDFSLPPIPKYENKIPNYDPVDLRVNAATIERDAFLIKESQKYHEKMKEEPTEFLAWQKNMREKDEELRREVIQKRREDLNYARKKAMKSKIAQIEERLSIGKQMRSQISDEIDRTRAEIEEEREKIRELKQKIDYAPIVVAKMKRQKKEQVVEMKKEIIREIRSARRKEKKEYELRRKNAEKVRYDAINHTNRHGDAFIQKKEITETKFLSGLTDEETEYLLKTNQERNLALIQERLEKHRKAKEEKMEKLYKLLEEETRIRDEAEIEHKKKRAEKKRHEEEEAMKKQLEEEEKILQLNKKLEKKRKERIKEAEEMEERTRQIAARNRYLALNKRAIEVKAFQSHQDARLRMAKERQDSRIQKPLRPPTPKKKKEVELTRLKTILGI